MLDKSQNSLYIAKLDAVFVLTERIYPKKDALNQNAAYSIYQCKIQRSLFDCYILAISHVNEDFRKLNAIAANFQLTPLSVDICDVYQDDLFSYSNNSQFFMTFSKSTYKKFLTDARQS